MSVTTHSNPCGEFEMLHFDMVGLIPLLKRTAGRPEVRVCIIDGPVALDHPALRGRRFIEIGNDPGFTCRHQDMGSCAHGTFIAGMLAAARSSATPGICPDCTFLVHPIFAERPLQTATTADALANAIYNSVKAGAHILNLSVNLNQISSQSHTPITEAIQYAADRGVIAVAAAPNFGTSAQSVLNNHPWVVTVVAAANSGHPLATSVLTPRIGRQGLSAPGEKVSVSAHPGFLGTLTGTSAAAAFVTGAIALIWSEVPQAKAVNVRSAVTSRPPGHRAGLQPPMLNAWRAYQDLRLIAAAN